MIAAFFLLQIAAVQCLPVAQVSDSFVALPLKRKTVHQGHSLVKRAANNSSLQLRNTGSYFETELSVGTPPQKIKMLLDTGSSDTWFDSSNRTENNFDYFKSATFKKNATAEQFSIGYGDQSKASGFWATDRLSVFGHSLEASFGVANESSAVSPIMGLGLRRGEISVTTVDEDNNLFPTYPNFPELLKLNGLVASASYSLCLSGRDETDETDDTGSVLFGALDHSNYEGESLTLLPLINDHSVSVSKTPTTLSVMLDSVDLPTNSQRQTLSVRKPVLIDSGSTLCQLPTNLVDSLGQMLNGTFSQDLGLYLVDCKAHQTIYFNFSGLVIPISTRDLIVPASLLTSDWNKHECTLGIFQTDTGKSILGEGFLKNVYAVFDLEKLEIGLAPMAKRQGSGQNYAAATPDIEIIGGSIPRATPAPLYVHTSLTR